MTHAGLVLSLSDRTRKISEDVFRDIGFTVSFVTSFEEAARTVASRQPEIALLDLTFPSINGTDENPVYTFVNMSPLTAVITIVEPGDTRKGLESLAYGAYYYLYSPIDERELRSTIAKYLYISTNKLSESFRRFHTLELTGKELETTSRIFRKRLEEISDFFSLKNILDARFILGKFFQTVIEYTMAEVKAARCSLVILDESGSDIFIGSDQIEGHDVFERVRLQERGVVTNFILKEKKPVLVRDIEKDPRFASRPRRDRYVTNSFIAVPIIIEGRIIAILNVTDKLNSRSLSPADLARLKKVANHVRETLASHLADFDFFVRRGIEDKKVAKTEKEKKKLASERDKLGRSLAETKEVLAFHRKELATLYTMGQILKTTFVVDELLKMIVDMITRSLKCKRCSVLMLDDEKGDVLVKGVIGKEAMNVVNLPVTSRGKVTMEVIGSGKSLVVTDIDSTNLRCEEERGYCSKAFMCVPIKIRDKVVAIINITDKLSGESFTTEDQKLLEFIASQLSLTIENFRLQEKLIEKERLTRELEIAHKIQANLFPTRFPKLEGYTLDFHNMPAKEVGGDYCDYIKLGEKKIGLAIGDVSGKGVPAALLMVMARSTLRVEAARAMEPSRVLSLVNTHLMEDIDQKMFITFLYGIVDMAKNEFVFSNGGHNYPLHYHAVTGEIEQLMLDGLVLGVLDGYEYKEKVVRLEKGDFIVLYTDGVIEAQNSSYEMFGLDRLCGVLKELASLQADEIRKGVEARIKEFAGSAPQYDDITLLVLKREE